MMELPESKLIENAKENYTLSDFLDLVAVDLAKFRDEDGYLQANAGIDYLTNDEIYELVDWFKEYNRPKFVLEWLPQGDGTLTYLAYDYLNGFWTVVTRGEEEIEDITFTEDEINFLKDRYPEKAVAIDLMKKLVSGRED